MVAGHVCIDFIPELDRPPGLVEGALYTLGPMRTRTGGCVHTTGLALRRFGVDVVLAAAVGRDELASVLTDRLAAEGIDASRFRVVDAATSYTIVVSPPGRDRTFWHHSGANDLFDGRELDLAGIDLLHVGYPNLLAALCHDDGAALVELFARAGAAGTTTSLDLAVVDRSEPGRVERWERFAAATFGLTDLITPSIDDLNSCFDWGLSADRAGLAEAGRRLVDLGVAVALVTAGSAGLQVATADRVRLERAGALGPRLGAHGGVNAFLPCVPVTSVAGTTGAGDVATAGFLSGLATGLDPVAAGRRATEVAARHVSGSEQERLDG